MESLGRGCSCPAVRSRQAILIDADMVSTRFAVLLVVNPPLTMIKS